MPPGEQPGTRVAKSFSSRIRRDGDPRNYNWLKRQLYLNIPIQAFLLTTEGKVLGSREVLTPAPVAPACENTHNGQVALFAQVGGVIVGDSRK